MLKIPNAMFSTDPKPMISRASFSVAKSIFLYSVISMSSGFTGIVLAPLLSIKSVPGVPAIHNVLQYLQSHLPKLG
jgi:hypothetical protein